MRVLADPYRFTRNERWTLALLLGGGLLVGLAAFVPAIRAILPTCPSYTLLELHCPGCGLTRASLALCHLDLAGAAASNALVFWVMSYVLYRIATALLGLATGKRLVSEWPRQVEVAYQGGFVMVWFALCAIRLVSWFLPGLNPEGIGLPPPS